MNTTKSNDYEAAYIKAAYAADVAEATYVNAVYNKAEAEVEAQYRLVEATAATNAADVALADWRQSNKEI